MTARFFSRDRLIALAVCVVASATRYSLRDERPARVETAANDALQLASDALDRHEQLRTDFAAGRLTDQEWADAIERETVLLWRQAVEMFERPVMTERRARAAKVRPPTSALAFPLRNCS